MPIALRRLWVQLTADRRRFGVLMAAFVVAVLLWARIIVISRPPRHAVADDAPPAREQYAAVTSKPRASDSAEPPIVDILLPMGLSRDPFRISPQHFPRPTVNLSSSDEAPKSTGGEAEDALRAEAERTAELRKRAQRFVLEAVMKGASLAVIDGQLTREGETLPGLEEEALFTLAEVRDRTVVIECEGRRFELALAGPIGRNRKPQN